MTSFDSKVLHGSQKNADTRHNRVNLLIYFYTVDVGYSGSADANQPNRYTRPSGRASERNFSRGYEGRYRAPKFYGAPHTLSGAMPLSHFFVE